MGSIGTGLLFAGLVILVMLVMANKMGAALIGALLLTVGVVALTTKDADGQNLMMKTANWSAWRTARLRGTNVYRSGPLGHTPWGTFQLPGLGAPLRISEFQDGYNRPFALLYCPATSSYSVTLSTEPDGDALVDREQIDVWVAKWGLWLNNLADEPGLIAASVTVESAPESGLRLRREVEGNLDSAAPRFAQEVLRGLVNEYPGGASSVRAYVTLTFSAFGRGSQKRMKPEDMGRDLATRLPGLTGSLSETGAGASVPLTAQRLCELVRVAYDPAAAETIDETYAAGETPELHWSDVGPSAAEASWDSYRHDSGFSRSWTMTAAPRGVVQANILGRVLAPTPEVARKRVSILYRPIDPARAAAIVEQDVNNETFRLTATDRPQARNRLAARAAEATAQEEAAGAGLVNFGIIVTATVLRTEDMAEAAVTIKNLGGQAKLRLRPAYGSQDSAFAATLPLGLVLPKHVKVPVEMREKL